MRGVYTSSCRDESFFTREAWLRDECGAFQRRIDQVDNAQGVELPGEELIFERIDVDGKRRELTYEKLSRLVGRLVQLLMWQQLDLPGMDTGEGGNRWMRW